MMNEWLLCWELTWCLEWQMHKNEHDEFSASLYLEQYHEAETRFEKSQWKFEKWAWMTRFLFAKIIENAIKTFIA